MAKSNPLRNIILVLTIVIALGSVVTITTFLIQTGIITIGLEETPQIVPPLAEIPVITPPDDGTEEPEDNIDPVTTEELIDQFLRALGVITVETFNVDVEVMLVDSNLEQQIQSAFLRVQPLDPREVIVKPDEEIDPSRLFINTDFSEQLAENGRNYHRYSTWDIVHEPNACRCSGGFCSSCPVPIVVTTQKESSCRVDNTGVCIQVSGSKNKDDDVGNASIITGLQKDVDISDWTKEGELIVEFDYSCNTSFTRGMQVVANVKGDTKKPFTLPCVLDGHFREEVSELVVDSNTLTVEFGGKATRVDNFKIDIQFNNAKVSGNSIVKRDAIEILQSLSIVQNDQDRRILDLGFIQTSMVGKTLEDNQRAIVNGVLETRIDGKTISTHVVTGNGITSNKELPLRIDGQPIFIFELQKQFFTEEEFHTFDIVLNDFIVSVGEGEESRIFEYHTPFNAYTLEFIVAPDEITAFSVQDQAITVLKSDTIFQTCGLSSGEDRINQPEVLPPVVNIIQNGFTIATTNPTAGKVEAIDPFTGNEIPNIEFCSTIPNLPVGTNLTFRIDNNFFEVNVPAIQKTFFVKCVREGCTSNIGFSDIP